MNLVHWNVKLGLNKIDSQFFTDVPSNIIDEELNRSQLIIIRDKLRSSLGFEFNRLIKSDLAPLVVLKEPVTPVGNEIKFNNLNLLHFVRADITAKKGNCIKSIYLTDKQLDDKSHLNAIQESSFKWGRAIGYIGKDSSPTLDGTSLYIHKPDFTILGSFIDYIKYPREVSIGGYDDINGNLKTTTEFEFHKDMIIQIIDFCVASLAAKLNYPDAELKYKMSQLSKIT